MLLSEETTRIGKITVHSLEYSRGGETLHRHEDQDEVLIIVDQLFEVVARETSSVLNPGGIVYLPVVFATP